MTIILDADALAPTDRAEAIRALIWDAVVRVEIEHHPDPASIHAQGQISDAGRLNICSIRSNATGITRTPRLAHDAVDAYLFLGLQVAGSSIVIQDGREAVLRPGDLAVYDTRQPYTLVNDHGIQQHFFRSRSPTSSSPPGCLARSPRSVSTGAGPWRESRRAICGSSPRTSAGSVPRRPSDVAEPSLALIRAMLASQIEDLPEAREYLERSLEHRIVAYMRAHLHEADLSAARIAREHHVSVRHLYRLLARSGIVLGDWIRQQRLEACRRALAEPGDTSTIAAVAHQWGFVDVTHFGRVFKAAYGMSPREWRTSSRASHWYLGAPDVARLAEDGSR